MVKEIHNTGTHEYDSVVSDNIHSPSRNADIVIWKDSDGVVYADGDEGVVNSGTDAQSVIKSAVDDLSSGGKVFISAGDYSISSRIEVTSDNLTIEGAGKDTKLRIEDGADIMDAIIRATDCHNLAIRGIYFDGNVRTNGTRSGHEGCLRFRGCMESIIEDCVFYDSYSSEINIDESSNNNPHKFNQVVNCVFNDHNGDASIKPSDGQHLLIANNRFTKAAAVLCIDCDDVIIVGNHSEPKKGGTNLSGDAYGDRGYEIFNCNNCVIANNVVVDCRVGDGGEAGKGISLNSSSRSIVEGNVVRECEGPGIVLTNSGDNKVEGNTITNVAKSSDANTKDAINCNGSTTNKANRIVDNAIHEFVSTNLRNGIFLDSYQEDSLVKDNYFRFISSPIEDNGTNNEIKQNLGYKTEDKGSATASGDGSTTTFSISHSLVKAPNYVSVEASSEDASTDFYISSKISSEIIITYAQAPASGTDNLSWEWEAEV